MSERRDLLTKVTFTIMAYAMWHGLRLSCRIAPKGAVVGGGGART